MPVFYVSDYEQPEPDDYRRYTENLVHAPPRPPGYAPHNNSLVNAVKNTLQRRAINYKRRNSFPGRYGINISSSILG